ncbi:MAG: LuxR C-terminal-related transcriptional regulator [Saprospiraceae bacterium]|nr:LuxR C-terminal-related transcriptional regulator [Saprospiraceae bacterium]
MKHQEKKNVTLSPREEEVANFLCYEWTCKEIAARIGLSETTVITHMVRIRKKLGVRNVAGVVRVVILNGWLKPIEHLVAIRV